MKQEELRQVQLAQLRIMDDIHRVCMANNLRYYMIGGTALGSVRHKGFIPWDVDIDIAMPREDYEKFVTIYSKELNEEFSCHDYRTDRKHFSPHAIVAMNNSIVKFKSSKLNPFSYGSYGLYVDILPLDRVPDDAELRNFHKKKLLKINRLRTLKSYAIYPQDSYFKRLAKKLVSNLIPMSLYAINKKQQEIAQMFNGFPSDMSNDVCSTLSHYNYEKLCMDSRIWGNPELLKFEGRQYYAPEKTIEYLTLLFGDYMKLPTKEQQEKSMSSIYYVEWSDENGRHSVGER